MFERFFTKYNVNSFIIYPFKTTIQKLLKQMKLKQLLVNN